MRGLGGDPTQLVLPHRGLRAAAFSPNGDEIATAAADGRVRVWRVADGTIVWTSHLPGCRPEVALTSTRVAAAWSGANKVAHVALLDSSDGRLLADLHGTTLEFSRDGSLLATGDPDSLARVYQSDDGTLVRRYGHGGPVTSVDFRRDGNSSRRRASTVRSRVWRSRPDTRLLLMPSGTSTVESARYSHDGRYIVSAGADGVARVWNARNSRPLVTFSGHRNTVADASFSRDGHLVITASDDGTARIWDTGLESQLRCSGERARSSYAPASWGGALALAAGRDGVGKRLAGPDRKLVLASPGLALVDAGGSGSASATVDDRGAAPGTSARGSAC